MFTETIEAGLLLFEKRNAIVKACKRIAYRIKKGKLRLAILGPGGVGKTTLGRLLSGKIDSYSTQRTYRESIDIEPFELPGDIPCTLLVAPGQERRRRRTWPGLFRELSTGKSSGIINVVAFGYHSFGGEISYREHKLYRKSQTKKQFFADFLEHQRNVELSVLDEIAPHIVAAKGKTWMITLVAKQDLWWGKRRDVKRHYMDGHYDDIITRIENQRGSEKFTHEYCSSSLVLQNLLTDPGEILAETVRGYDQARQAVHLKQLVDTVHELACR